MVKWSFALNLERGGHLLVAAKDNVLSYKLSPTVDAAYRAGLNFASAKHVYEASYWYQEAIGLNSSHLESMLELGILIHYQGYTIQYNMT